jgi:hypothetical protein
MVGHRRQQDAQRHMMEPGQCEIAPKIEFMSSPGVVQDAGKPQQGKEGHALKGS